MLGRESGPLMDKQLAELRQALLDRSKPLVATTQRDHTRTLKRVKTENYTPEVPIWLGHYYLKQGQSSDLPYFTDRGLLSDAAYYGKWDHVLDQSIKSSKETYDQNWVNGCRILDDEERLEKPSGFTPLHQAAWHGATPSVVRRLIDIGAWRLSRTMRNGLMQTPLDVAKDYGWTHLYPLLTPVIYHTLPPSVLLSLQSQMDRFFATNFPEAVDHSAYHRSKS